MFEWKTHTPLAAALFAWSLAAAEVASSAEAMDHSHEHGQSTQDAESSSIGNQAQSNEDVDHRKHRESTPAEMDHRTMDHGAMDHEAMGHHPSPVPPNPSPVPPTGVVPALTDRDRSAVFIDERGHTVHDHVIIAYANLDRLEWQDAENGSVLHWNVDSWIGGDINRLWIRSEGERADGVTEEAELQLLFGRATTPWWDVVAGIRQDFQPGSPQTWAAFGIQGMPLYQFEVEATAFIGEAGQTGARLEADYDLLITNRLKLQPVVEVDLYGKNDPDRGVGSGLANTELGLRLRYEIIREVTPYIGVTWSRSYGNTADFLQAGEDRSEGRFVAGVRLWY